MVGDETVQFPEFGDDVVGFVPVETGVAVDADFFRCQPFHAAGEAKAAAGTGQRAETVAQERPDAAFVGEPAVVVRFAVMDVAADAFILAVGVVEIPRDVFAGIILKQFGVSPLHAALGEQAFRGFP